MYPYTSLWGIELPTYGLLVTLGAGLCCLCAYRRIKQLQLSVNSFLIIAALAIGCAMIGAKVLYIFLTFSPSQIISFLSKGSYQEMLQGGFVFYGGLLFGLLGAVFGAKLAEVALLSYEQAIVPFLPLAYGIGRLGCFFAGCCYGFPYNGPLAVTYPHSSCPRFPVQLLDAVFSILSFLFLLAFSQKTRKKGTLLLIYLLVYAIQRFFLEFLRGDEIRGASCNLSTSQWISMGIFLFCICLFLFRRKTHRP